MTIPTLALARALQRTRPPVWPLRFVVSALEPARRRAPGFYRAHAPSHAGTYMIEAVGPRVVLSFVPRRGAATTTQHGSIDDAETAAMQHALEALGKYRPRLRWRASKDKDFKVQAEVDLPIWGDGVLSVPGHYGGQWNGREPWGQPYRSSMPNSREGAQRFVDDWLVMTTRGVRYYRVFPYIVGKDEAYPAGATRQLRIAEVIELATKIDPRRLSTERQRALITADISPIFNWDLSSKSGRFRPVPSEEHPSKRQAEHQGFFTLGQITGAYEIVEYTTGARSQARSLGIWKPPTLAEWREHGDREATKIEPRVASKGGAYGQLELLAEIAELALEAAL